MDRAPRRLRAAARARARGTVSLPTPDELAAAAPAYAASTGRPIDATSFDPTRPENAAAWAAFSRRTVRLPRGGHEGEWLLLELGLKPVLRQWLPPERLDGFAARCARRGLVFARGSAEGIGREARRDCLVYVARDAGRAEAARDAETALLARQGQPRADATRRAGDADAARALGALLGFPACCIDAFVAVARDGRDEKAGMLRYALLRSEAFHARLNNLSLGAFHYIGWSPCRFDCPDSLAIASRAAEELRRRDEAAFVVVERILARPRLWFEERRQLIFSGRFEGGVLRFKAVRTPWALDGDDRHRALEWLHYADVAGPLIGGGALVPGGTGRARPRATGGAPGPGRRGRAKPRTTGCAPDPGQSEGTAGAPGPDQAEGTRPGPEQGGLGAGEAAWTLHRAGREPMPWSPSAGGLFVPFGGR